MTSVRERERDLPDLDAEENVDLRRHWVAITTHWWLPVAGLVAGVIVGYLISLGGAQVYKAKATVYLGQPLSQGGVQVQSQATNPSTVRTIVTAESTIDSVARQVGLRPSQLRGKVTTQSISGAVTRLGQNPNVAIIVTGHLRGKVGAAANHFANAVIASLAASYAAPKIQSLQKLVDSETVALDTLNKNIKAQQAGLNNPGLSNTDRLVLASQINGLQQQLVTTTGQLTTNQQQLLLAKGIEAPQLLTRAVATKTTARSRRNTVIVAALIGLLLGIVAALLYEPVLRGVRSRS